MVVFISMAMEVAGFHLEVASEATKGKTGLVLLDSICRGIGKSRCDRN
jgi:hypothetical protein